MNASRECAEWPSLIHFDFFQNWIYFDFDLFKLKSYLDLFSLDLFSMTL